MNLKKQYFPWWNKFTLYSVQAKKEGQKKQTSGGGGWFGGWFGGKTDDSQKKTDKSMGEYHRWGLLFGAYHFQLLN